MTNASPINQGRGKNQYSTNIPMSYDGPPTAAEINRNERRRDQSRSQIPDLN